MDYVIAVLIFLGSFFMFVAAVGMLRMGDVLSRLHASTKATSFGMLLLLAGFCIYFLTWFTLLKTLLIIAFVYLTAPLAAHSIAKLNIEKDKKHLK
ncbi:MAG: monovalent cation/H(+) antiporter subunit G [Bacteroidales bacterium]|nr:monovalent cation/H(+) antiporter subunit G [Bacteroidales bacterium]